MIAKRCTNAEIEEKLSGALDQLLSRDRFLLEHDAHERSLVHKLAEFCDESSLPVVTRVTQSPMFERLSGEDKARLTKLFSQARWGKKAEAMACPGAKSLPDNTFRTLIGQLER